MYLISVYFDDKSNKIISNYINKIAQKTGNTFMTDNHVPPHLKIMSVEAREEKKLTEVMEQLERSLTKGQIQLVSVGVLLPYVLYAAPVLNLYLEDMIEQVHDMVKHIPEVRMSRYYQPMQWIPHITLGKKLSKEQMQEAFSVMQELFAPMEVTVAEIGLAKTNPHQDLIRVELNASTASMRLLTTRAPSPPSLLTVSPTPTS